MRYYAQQQNNYAMKDITYIQAQIQSPLSITEFSILVNLSVAISGDARLRFITRTKINKKKKQEKYSP